jgi:hypothetical protein
LGGRGWWISEFEASLVYKVSSRTARATEKPCLEKKKKKKMEGQRRPVVAHAFNPLGGRGWWITEFEASLVYRVSSRTARATQRNPILKKKNQSIKQTNKQKTKPNQTKQNK